MKILKAHSMPLVISVVLLFMILSRLTWLQLRHDAIESVGFLGPEFLNLWHLENFEVRSWNINTLIVLFFLSALMVRLLTHSWVSGLFAVTVLMSRGVVIARVGWMSLDLILTGVLVAWLTCVVHYFRTASLQSRRLSWIFLAAGTLLEPSFCSLGLALPVFRFFLLHRYKKHSQSAARGDLLHALSLSFKQWLRTQYVPHKDSIAEILFTGILFVLAFTYREEFPQALNAVTVLSFLDLHFIASCFVICGFAIYGWRKDSNIFKFPLFLILCFLIWLLAVSLFPSLDMSSLDARALLMYFEPTILCIASAYALYFLEHAQFKKKRTVGY